jgi:hypothetical protein
MNEFLRRWSKHVRSVEASQAHNLLSGGIKLFILLLILRGRWPDYIYHVYTDPLPYRNNTFTEIYSTDIVLFLLSGGIKLFMLLLILRGRWPDYIYHVYTDPLPYRNNSFTEIYSTRTLIYHHVFSSS